MSTAKGKKPSSEPEKIKAPAKAAVQPQRLIYCGPNIPGGELRQFTIFRGGYPKYLSELFIECSAIKELFVPVADLARTRADAEKPGSEVNRLCQEVRRHFEDKAARKEDN